MIIDRQTAAAEFATAYRAYQIGEVIGCGDEREDGGWDFVVDTEEGEILVSVIRGDDDLLHAIAA